MSNIETIGEAITLGEGPMWHPLRQRLYWFDIPAGKLYSTNSEGGQPRQWLFGEPASACGWVDKDTLLVATASGLQKFDINLGSWQTLVTMEADNPVTRSNDGRTAPDGSFWIGTMGLKGEHEAGAYYRYTNGALEKILHPVSIPNSTCFSPDGKIAYLSDTRRQLIWRWHLDDQGAPLGEKQVHIDLRDGGYNPDGSVIDSEGFLWNAQWGGWRIVRYDPDGREDRVIELPVQQPTCPCFGGRDLKRLYITSARDRLSEEELEKQPDAGKVLVLDVGIAGLAEYQVKL